MPGPKAKSVQLRLVEGVKPDAPELNRVVAPRARYPQAPTWMSLEAKKIYRETSRRLSELSLNSEVDTDFVISYVMTVVVMRECERAISEAGIKAGYSDVWEKAHRRFVAMSKELGLTPAARASLKLQPEPAPTTTEMFAS